MTASGRTMARMHAPSRLFVCAAAALAAASCGTPPARQFAVETETRNAPPDLAIQGEVLQLDVAPAIAEASAWLAQADEGRYGECWERAAALLRERVTRADWEKLAASLRESMGPALARKMRSASVVRILPNAPEGEYVVIQYDTVFANRALATELVTPMREPDGRWRVAGYVVR